MLLLQKTAGFEVFTPQLSDLWVGFGASVALFVAFAIGGFMLYGRKTDDARVKVVLPMLMYMASLLALVSIGGHFLSIQKYPIVEISPTKIRVDGELYPRPRPDALRVETVEDKLTQKKSQILLLYLKGQQTIALPESRYDVREMLSLLKK